jgi:hypothetical protein
MDRSLKNDMQGILYKFSDWQIVRVGRDRLIMLPIN